MWLEFHDSARDHPKILKLAKDLGIEDAHALGHIAALWAWTLTMAPDGNLSSFDYDDIELGAKWKGEAGAFVGAAVNRKLLDKIDGNAENLELHDWEDYAQHLKAAQRKREERARKREKSQDVTGRHRTSQDKPPQSQDVTTREGGCHKDRPTDRPTDQTDRPDRAREETENIDRNRKVSFQEFKDNDPFLSQPGPSKTDGAGDMPKGLLIQKPFAERYQAAMGCLWQRGPQYDGVFRQLEDWCRAQALDEKVDLQLVIGRLLDGFFAEDYARQVSYTPSLLAKNPGKYYKPPDGQEPERDAAYYQRELKALQEKYAKAEAAGEKGKYFDRMRSKMAILKEKIEESTVTHG